MNPRRGPEPQESISIITDDPQLARPLGIHKFYRSPVMGRLIRFSLGWLIISGIYASSSACPFCGQVGCPVGGASAGIVGGLFALIITGLKVFLNHLNRLFSLIRAKLTASQK